LPDAGRRDAAPDGAGLADGAVAPDAAGPVSDAANGAPDAARPVADAANVAPDAGPAPECRADGDCAAPPPRCDGDVRHAFAGVCREGRCDVRDDAAACAPDTLCAPEGCRAAPPYPDALPFKGIQPDGDGIDDIAGNGAGRVAMNLVWASWEPARIAPPCPDGAVEYDGHCFRVDPGADAYMRAATARGVGITGIVYGSPPWARAGRQGCPRWAGDASEIFCAPDDFADYARFAGFLAWYYRGDGSPGGARVDDFVVWNEVNHQDWFSLGGWPDSDPGPRLQGQADLYWAAWDAIARHRPQARVYVSLTHRFSGGDPHHLSGYDVLDRVASAAAGRRWHVALHPYSVAVGGPGFSDDDRPYETFGTLGLLTGWLASRWPDATPTVLITEVGFTSQGAGSSPQLQADTLCAAYREALGAPGVTGFIYHRYRDHPAETAAGLYIGLSTTDGQLKPAWAKWALMDRDPQRDCGFEDAPYVRLQRYRNPDGRYWVTPRDPRTRGYAPESTWWLVARAPEAGTRALFDCQVPGTEDHFLSPDPRCEGQLPTGPVGFAWTDPGPGLAPIHRCFDAPGGRHFASTHEDCEGWAHEQLLGYGRR
jgi:hypothetical protein